jgi:hypothetical protein
MLEHFLPSVGLAAVGVFAKQLSNYIYSENFTYVGAPYDGYNGGRPTNATSGARWPDRVADPRPKELSTVQCLGFLNGSHSPQYDKELARRPLYQKLIGSGQMKPGYACRRRAAAVRRPSFLRLGTALPKTSRARLQNMHETQYAVRRAPPMSVREQERVAAGFSRMNDSARTGTIGLIMAAFGLWAVAIGMNIVHIAPSKDIPRWAVGVLGGAFAFAGLSIFLRAGFASPGASPPPKGIVLLQWLCATVAPALLTGLCAWVSLGPGPRHFRSGGVLAFMTQNPRAAETNGRIGFGVAAALLALMTITTLAGGLRRIAGRGA